MINSLISLTKDLISHPSITPNDHHCQNIIINYLKPLNFYIEPICFHDTHNLWAYRYGLKKKYQEPYTLLFLGHTDVVSPGNIKDWIYPPFLGLVHDGVLYGRGASDMKGALAAMLIATKKFITQHPNHTERIAFLITSDEEGNGLNGTTKVIESLMARNERINYCIVGEPSSKFRIGDIIKNGRRGSYTGILTIQGSSGHVAYPQFLTNPIHLINPILSELLTIQWDQNQSVLFPPTSMQITNIQSIPNNISNNITPNQLILKINFRFNDQCSIYNIQKKMHQVLSNYHVNYQIDWINPSLPYFSNPGKLSKIVTEVIKFYQKITPTLETTGGTSDGRFISKTGAEIIELGALNNTIHKANECINIADLELLSYIYLGIMKKILL